MSAGFDVSALLGLFLDEAHEQLDVLERTLVTLEPGRIGEDEIAGAFRAAHALKGSARTMGFENIGAAAHALEDSLEGLRQGTPVTPQLKEAMLNKLDAIRAGLAATTPATPQRHLITVTMAAGCAMKSIRAELVLRALEAHGTVVETVPPRSNLDHETFDVTLESRLTVEALCEVAAGQPEVAACTPKAEASPKAPEPARKDSTVRVPTSRLDQIVDLSSELTIERSRLGRCAHLMSLAHPDDPRFAELTEIADRMAQLVGDLQHVAFGVRLLPIEGTFRRLVRMAHDISGELGKQVELHLEGIETEVDRSVADVILDPLIHLVRNSIDHGIEPPDLRRTLAKPVKGSITLRAWHEEGLIHIEVEDDGRGIDAGRMRESAEEKGLLAPGEDPDEAESIQLIFRSGFTTASALSEISGRGVGMDIVRANLEKVGGRIDVRTVVGAGTTFHIALPVSLAVVRCLLVEAGTAIIALPEGQVSATSVLPCDRPTLSLAAALEGKQAEASESTYAVLVEDSGTCVALAVDRLIAEVDLVVKPLAGWVVPAPGVLGASILANGRVVLIVDPIPLVAGVTPQPNSV